jgi:hypothetical protein
MLSVICLNCNSDIFPSFQLFLEGFPVAEGNAIRQEYLPDNTIISKSVQLIIFYNTMWLKAWMTCFTSSSSTQ